MFEALLSPTLLKWREPGWDGPAWMAVWVSLTEDGVKAVAPKWFRWSLYSRLEVCEVNPEVASSGGYVLTFLLKPRTGLDVFGPVKKVRVPPDVSVLEVVGILKFKGVKVTELR